MDLDFRNLLESFFRWVHVGAGITWIGLLYFFNWVNATFAPTLDADSKKKVVPELMPRALYFFRWGAAFTWISGLLLLGMVYYETGLAFESDKAWNPIGIGMLVLVFVAPFIYDPIMKAVKDPKAQAGIGFVLASGFVMAMILVGGFSYRGAAIHLGAMFGTIMAFNVWYRIWPNQRLIINGVKNGPAADPAVVALAGLRSKHNTYMSVPLIFMMISQHGTWAASLHGALLPVVIAVGWMVTMQMYNRSKKDSVKAF
jgi:uncharacterized membrane protein